MTGASCSWQLVKYMPDPGAERVGDSMHGVGFMCRHLAKKRPWISAADFTLAARWPYLPSAVGGVQRAEPEDLEEGRRHEEADSGLLGRHIAILAIFVSNMCVAGAALADDWRALEGPAIRRTFSGREYGDGAHYAHRFLRDGSFEGTEMGRTVQGRWHVEGKQLCTDRIKPRTSQQCYEVERSGDEVRLLSNGYAVFNGRLSPIAGSQSPARR